MTLALQSERHGQITLAPSNSFLKGMDMGGMGLALGSGGQGSSSLLCTSSAPTPTLGSSLPLPWLQQFHLTDTQAGV